MKPKFYILDENMNPKLCEDHAAWTIWYIEGSNRVLFNDKLPDGTLLSTMFTGIDHGTCPEGETLWETIIANSERTIAYKRYKTRDEAEAGHRHILMRLHTFHINNPHAQ